MIRKTIKQAPSIKFILCLLFLFFGSHGSLWAQGVEIKITDCQTGKAIQGVYVVDGSSQLLAKSNSLGICHFTVAHWPLFLKRYGYRTRAIYEKSDLKKVICLNAVKNKLPTVVVKGKKSNLQKYLLALRDKNLPWFITHDTTTYYQFTYTLQFPEEHWQEKATGYLAYHWRRHKSVLTGVDYLQYHYSCTDTNFWHSPYYQAVQPNGVYHVLHYNLMGNDDGYQLWKRLVNKENEGLRIPIPTFLLSKEHKDLIKKINKDPEKYHLSQYGSENRKLTLRFDSLKDLVFETHYTDYADTTGYVAEKLIFDSLKRLKTVYYYTPEQLTTHGFSWDSTTVNSVQVMSKINNDSSYYYSRYTYDVQHKPILLKQVRHLGTFYVDGQRYRVTVNLDLINTKPKEDFKVNAYYFTNVDFIGLEKVQKVLGAIKANAARKNK